ncbi:quercetin dioxygenase-like cupin family protein/heme-degrading monooxygenase HmoA [Pseudoclavibacter sp. JAI123]|uniref:cupin domain-containing protein n=1 Tax=Pseudoclavibacter sp. JAI123 TaxID=2723065 RepID=UPI00184F6F95|nr:cupin domain-containing protein [Pseudoclavibacter sp. JAI123]NYF14807.1 quercetin dioxygenase-like cupin family protein/heme-degrading monooxygenase HmoA [Pseudoclavibacter sp. JAI123]
MSDSQSATSQTCHVLRPSALPSKNRGGGAKTVPLVTYERGATSFLSGTTIFDPGAAIGHHVHNVLESVAVIEGTAIVDIDGERTLLDTFDTTVVPANVPHHFENASESEPMRILWVYASVDATRTLLESGEHGRIDGEGLGSSSDRSASEAAVEVVDLFAADADGAALEAAVAAAAPLFQQAVGARSFTLERSVEDSTHYRLLVRWETVEDHTESFRSSEAFTKWRELIIEHLSTPPRAEHFRQVLTAF